MNRLLASITIGAVSGVLTGVMLVAGIAYAEMEPGVNPATFNENMAIQQIMNVLSGVSLRQADNTSTQTLKEFSAWRERQENTAEAAKVAPNGRKLPPARSRKAY